MNYLGTILYLCRIFINNMEIVFENEYLRELYEEGKTKNKKYRFQPSIIDRYKRVVDTLRNAPDTEFLYKLHNLNYEKLQGNKKNIESVRVNNQYRIEFRSYEEEREPNKVIICSLLELSNHYK